MPEQQMPSLTAEERSRLRTANPSPELMALVQQAPETVGRDRNSARELVRTLLRADEDLQGDALRAELESGGHFFTALLDGYLGEAFVRADITNTRLLLHTFGPVYIEECLIYHEDFSTEEAKRYVQDRIENFGDKLDL